MDQNQPMQQPAQTPETPQGSGSSKAGIWIIILLVVIIVAVVLWIVL